MQYGDTKAEIVQVVCLDTYSLGYTTYLSIMVVVVVYNHELTLIGYEISTDEIGNEVRVPIKRHILCKIKDVGSAEFYNAQVTNLKPEIKFIIHSFEYQGETEVEF